MQTLQTNRTHIRIDNGHDETCAWAWGIRQDDGYILNVAKLTDEHCGCGYW